MLSTPLMLLSLLTFLPPKCFVRGDWKRSTASQESWIIHRLWRKRFSIYITILEDFHQILPGCYRAAALISACSRHLSIPLGLSGFWAFLEKYRDTAFINSAWEFLCAWPVFFFVPIFSEFFLLFQVDNFPIDLLWCERGHQHLPIGTGKSRGGSMKSSPAGTLLRSSKRRSRFSIFFFLSAFWFSLLPGFGWYWRHPTAQCSCAQEQMQVLDLPIAISKRECQEWEEVEWGNVCSLCSVSQGLGGRHIFLFECWDQSWERTSEIKTEKQQIWALYCTW